MSLTEGSIISTAAHEASIELVTHYLQLLMEFMTRSLGLLPQAFQLCPLTR